MLAVRTAFLLREGLAEDAFLADAQHHVVMQELRGLYYKEEAFSRRYEENVKEVGVDMAQRRRRSHFRSAMCWLFGHPVVADVLLIRGFWSKDLQDRLAEERGHQRIAGGPELSKPPPSTNRTKTGRRKIHGAAKTRKRERYFSNVAAKERVKEC